MCMAACCRKYLVYWLTFFPPVHGGGGGGAAVGYNIYMTIYDDVAVHIKHVCQPGPAAVRRTIYKRAVHQHVVRLLSFNWLEI